jgi:hypothetical protein
MSLIHSLWNAHVDAFSTRWSTLHLMVWYWHALVVSCKCDGCGTLLITSTRESAIFELDKSWCEMRQRKKSWWLQSADDAVQQSSVVFFTLVCWSVVCCGSLQQIKTIQQKIFENITYCLIERFFNCQHEAFHPTASMTLYRHGHSESESVTESHHPPQLKLNCAVLNCTFLSFGVLQSPQ